MATQTQVSNQNAASTSAQNAAIASSIDSQQAEAQRTDETNVQYTLFASGINHGGQDTILQGKNLTDDVAIVFDVVEQHTYSQRSEKTSYAIESRAKASSHMSIEDGKFTFSARISDSPQIINKKNYLDKDTDPNNPLSSKRPAKSLEVLTAIIRSRQLITLVTEDNILTNYVITSIDASRNNSDGAALVYQIEMEEFRLVTLGRTVLATGTNTNPKKASNVQKGAKQTAEGGPVDDSLKGIKSPYAGPTEPTYRRLEENTMGTKFDIDGNGERIIRPDGKFSSTSLIR